MVEEFLRELVLGVVNGFGRQAGLAGFAVLSGGTNLWFLYNAATRPGKAKSSISKELDSIASAVLDSYDCIRSRRELDDPDKIEEASRRIMDRLGFLATMADMKRRTSDYEQIQVAIHCAESVRLFGGFVRRFCTQDGTRRPGIRYYGWLQDSSKLLDDIAGVPEAIEKIRDVIGKRRKDKLGLREARDKAIPVVAEALNKSEDGMFLTVTQSPT